MFPPLPTMIDQLRGGRDAAPLVDAAVGWARAGAACEAQRLAAMAEWAAVFLADDDEDTSLCAVDAEDDVVAQIGLAFGMSPRWAFNDLQVGAAMRDRFPKLAAMFLRGEISAQVMATVVERTLLVVDDDALAHLDAACVEAAALCGWSGLSYYRLKNAVDVWVERFDPDAVRRVRNTVRGRGVSVEHTDDETGITTIKMRLTKPGGALLMGTLRTMAKAVCANDPRTLDQRMADAAEALVAGAGHLKCRCGSPTCPATADDGVAAKFVVHIYGDAPVSEGEPDPLIHGDGVFPTGPDNVTVKHPGKRTKTEAAPDDAAPTEAELAETEDEAVDEPAQAAPETEDGTDQVSRSSTPRHCPAPTVSDAEPPAGDQPKPDETPTPTTPSTVSRAPGFIPGYGVVPHALIAALIAAGAEVRHTKAPSVEPTESYRLRDSDREFVQARDLTCRAPGCDRPIHEADLDHTIPWGDGGPTHPSNQKGYCRRHHLLKTFRDGWSEVQNPDGTLRITTPTGHTYTSIPLSRILFPGVNTTSAPVQRGSPRKQAAADKMSKMPKRQRSKAQDRAYRIAAERALNAAYRATGGAPTHHAAAPKDNWGYRLFFEDHSQRANTDDPPPF
jgi:hypothetical protein